MSVSFAYLLSRRPELIEVRVSKQDDGLAVDFIDQV